MLLKNKVAVIYGAGGAIGGAVARAFAQEGAKLFLTGSRRAPLEAVAKDIQSAGGAAEVAEVDALDEKAADKHPAVGDRQGGPHRYLVQRDRYSDGENRGPLAGRDGCRDVLPAHCSLYAIVLSNRAPGSQAHDSE